MIVFPELGRSALFHFRQDSKETTLKQRRKFCHLFLENETLCKYLNVCLCISVHGIGLYVLSTPESNLCTR